MTQEERRVWLIAHLLEEMPQYKDTEIPQDPSQQRLLLRALFNVRLPSPVTKEFSQVEGEYLRQVTEEKGITDVNDLKPCMTDHRLYLWQGDITTLKCDAIVNAANSGMTGCYQPNHNCIDNAEQTYAGAEMRYECDQYMEKQASLHGGSYEEPTGQAVVTKGYNLPARYVIHTVGPIVQGWLTKKDQDLLASCYRSCLEKADAYHLESIAFCCISTGVFMFPQDKAAEIAVHTVKEYLDSHSDGSIEKVVFNVFKDSDLQIYDALLNRKIRMHKPVL